MTSLYETLKRFPNAAPLLGKPVEVAFLKTQPKYNGKMGRATHFHPETGRYTVAFDNDEDGSQSKAFKPSNLLLLKSVVETLQHEGHEQLSQKLEQQQALVAREAAVEQERAAAAAAAEAVAAAEAQAQESAAAPAVASDGAAAPAVASDRAGKGRPKSTLKKQRSESDPFDSSDESDVDEEGCSFDEGGASSWGVSEWANETDEKARARKRKANKFFLQAKSSKQKGGQGMKSYLEDAARLGHADAANELANLYNPKQTAQQGGKTAVLRDESLHHEWLVKAAKWGSSAAMVNLAVWYEQQQNDPVEGYRLIRRAAKDHTAAAEQQALAMTNLAVAYFRGNTPNGTNRARAKKWAMRACATAQHYVRAWLFLGEISSTSIMITPLLKSHEASLADIILSLQVFTRAKVSAGLQSVRLASTDA